MMQKLLLYRRIMFSVVTVSSLVVLGISAWFKAASHKAVIDSVFTFANFGIACAALTLLCIIPMRIIDRVRKHAITSVVAVELSWVGLLWILWLAEGGLSAAAADTNLCLPVFFFAGPDAGDFGDVCFVHWPAIVNALLGFLIFGMLFAWFIILVTYAIRNNHWTSHIDSGTDLGVPRASTGGAAPAGNVNYSDTKDHTSAASPQQPHPAYLPQYQNQGQGNPQSNTPVSYPPPSSNFAHGGPQPGAIQV